MENIKFEYQSFDENNKLHLFCLKRLFDDEEINTKLVPFCIPEDFDQLIANFSTEKGNYIILANERPVGWIRNRIDVDDNGTSFSTLMYALTKQYRHTKEKWGYRFLSDYLDKLVNIDEVRVITSKKNIASRNLIQKLGFISYDEDLYDEDNFKLPLKRITTEANNSSKVIK